MVVNFSRLFTRDIALNSLIDKIGAGNLDFGTPADVTRTRPVSIVGVSGSPNGSATVSAVYRGCKCIGTMDESNMDGYLRLNGSTGLFEFVRTDLFEFNTDEPTTAGRLRIRLGPNPFTRTLPTDGSSGFLMATVVASNMFPIGSDLFVTNNPDGSENAAEQTRMANALVDNVSGENSSGRILVALQAFGTPKGKGAGWQQIQQGIEKLGGNGQVFAQLNQGRPDEPYQGRYALVGRAAMGVPAAESSQSLTGRDTDGKLRGLLARGRDDQYLPLLADPLGSINFGLVSIVNRAPTSISGFPRYTGGRAAAEQFLARSRDPLIMGVCAPDAPTCDPRKAYYENYFGSGTSWDTILTALGQRAKDACTAEAAKPGAPFSDAECQEVRRQLETEVDARNRVAAYFGPDGLQRPFLGGAGTSAIVNIAAISAAIQSDVQPPVGDNTASHALNIVSFVVKIAGAGGGLVNPAVGTAANGLAAAFGIAGYLTKQDGSPDLIGPDVSKRATDLGVELNERYQRVSSYFTTEAKIVMSDWSKMREVAAAVSEPSWRLNLDDSTRLLDVATKRAIYQALVPTAYPYFYDLGTGVAHAKDWICRSSPRSPVRQEPVPEDRDCRRAAVPAARDRSGLHRAPDGGRSQEGGRLAARRVHPRPDPGADRQAVRQPPVGRDGVQQARVLLDPELPRVPQGPAADDAGHPEEQYLRVLDVPDVAGPARQRRVAPHEMIAQGFGCQAVRPGSGLGCARFAGREPWTVRPVWRDTCCRPVPSAAIVYVPPWSPIASCVPSGLQTGLPVRPIPQAVDAGSGVTSQPAWRDHPHAAAGLVRDGPAVGRPDRRSPMSRDEPASEPSSDTV